MAKDVELLNSYSNTNKAATVQKIESAAAAQGGFYTVFYGQEGNLDDRKSAHFNSILKEEVSKNFPDATILATVAPDGKRAVVCYTQEPLKDIVDKYQEISGEKMKRDERIIPFDEKYELTKWRGHLGNMGQVFITASGLGWNKYIQQYIFKDPTAAGKENKFKSMDKVISSIASVAGNGLNSWFGVQKKPDDVRLQIVKRKSSAYIHKYSPNPVELPDNRDRLTPYTWREKPETTEEKTQVFLQQNAGIMSEVLKIVGKYSYFRGGKKKDNDGDRVHGAVSMAAKFVTVLGKDEDQFGLDTADDWFSRLRKHSNLISGGMEWIANISQFAGALLKKVPAELSLSAIYKAADDGSFTNDVKWDAVKQQRFAATFGEEAGTNFNDLIDKGYIKRVEDSIDPVTNKIKKAGHFVYARDIHNDYHLAKAGTPVKGVAFTPGKKDKPGETINEDTRPLKLREKSSPGWQLVDWKNNFLMKPKEWDWLQLIGATFFTLSLSTKMMAPFTEKKVNVDELFAHNAVGIAALPEFQRAEQLAGLTQHLLEMKAPNGIDMLPELTKKGLAETYAGIANTLYQCHQWDIPAQQMRTAIVVHNDVPQPANDITQATEKSAETAAYPTTETTKSLAAEAVESAVESGGKMFANAAEASAIVNETTQPEEKLPIEVSDIRNRIQEARERGTGAFTEKFGQTEGMALGVSATAS